MNALFLIMKGLCPCGERHSQENHFCSICLTLGFKHLEKECPNLCRCERVEPHASDTHQCQVCFKVGFIHNDTECPARCPCEQAHSIATHKCRLCKRVGYNHSLDACPMKCHCGHGTTVHSVAEHPIHVDKVVGYAEDDCPCPCLNKCVADKYCRMRNTHSRRRHTCFICRATRFTHDVDACPMECRCGKYHYVHSTSEH